MESALPALLNVLIFWMLTTPHEFAHAWVATRLGDDTPLREGRVTLNPLAHVDWLGTAILPFATSLLGYGFLGWGKPVRTETAKLRGGLNGLAVVALAGPFSNVIMGGVPGAPPLGLAAPAPPLGGGPPKGEFVELLPGRVNMDPRPPRERAHARVAAP